MAIKNGLVTPFLIVYKLNSSFPGWVGKKSFRPSFSESRCNLVLLTFQARSLSSAKNAAAISGSTLTWTTTLRPSTRTRKRTSANSAARSSRESIPSPFTKRFTPASGITSARSAKEASGLPSTCKSTEEFIQVSLNMRDLRNRTTFSIGFLVHLSIPALDTFEGTIERLVLSLESLFLLDMAHAEGCPHWAKVVDTLELLGFSDCCWIGFESQHCLIGSAYRRVDGVKPGKWKIWSWAPIGGCI